MKFLYFPVCVYICVYTHVYVQTKKPPPEVKYGENQINNHAENQVSCDKIFKN